MIEDQVFAGLKNLRSSSCNWPRGIAPVKATLSVRPTQEPLAALHPCMRQQHVTVYINHRDGGALLECISQQMVLERRGPPASWDELP